MDCIQFFCPMIPPTATGQMRQVHVVNGKPRFYEPEDVAAARAKLLAHLCRHMPPQPYSDGLRLIVKWCFPRGSHPAGYRITAPDTDNLQKLLKDVMTRCGFWKDDALVCSEIVEKFWSDVPGIWIRLEPIEAAAHD